MTAGKVPHYERRISKGKKLTHSCENPVKIGSDIESSLSASVKPATPYQAAGIRSFWRRSIVRIRASWFYPCRTAGRYRHLLERIGRIAATGHSSGSGIGPSHAVHQQDATARHRGCAELLTIRTKKFPIGGQGRNLDDTALAYSGGPRFAPRLPFCCFLSSKKALCTSDMTLDEQHLNQATVAKSRRFAVPHPCYTCPSDEPQQCTLCDGGKSVDFQG